MKTAMFLGMAATAALTLAASNKGTETVKIAYAGVPVTELSSVPPANRMHVMMGAASSAAWTIRSW
jgi:hypothetical protein